MRSFGYPWYIWLWNSPNTLLGMMLGLWSASIADRKETVINYRMRSGLPLLVCQKLGISAFTMGDCVLYAVEPTMALHYHEGRHVQQYRVLGPLFLPVYFTLMAFFGYYNHPLERDARRHEQLALKKAVACTDQVDLSEIEPA